MASIITNGDIEWKYLADMSNYLAQRCPIQAAIMKEEDMKSAAIPSEGTSKF